MATVFRIEDSEGRGPYGPNRPHSERADQLIYSHNDCEKHPTPWFDGDLGWKISKYEHSRRQQNLPKSVLLYGFESMTQLFNWFSMDDLHTLREIGFVVKTFEVPSEHILRGDCQVVFPLEFR